jgi:hypothetical protein
VGVRLVWTGLLFALAAPGQSNDAAWPAVRQEHKPWTRWWWHGSAVDRANITAELESFARAGIGGVEITPIYGVKGAESRHIGYLSPQWIEMVRHAAAEAKRLGLGVDLTPGSGWRIGGPWVAPDYANASMKLERVALQAGARHRFNAGSRPIQAIVGWPEKGEPADLTARLANGAFDWTAPGGGAWTLYVLEQVPSGERVKRPAPGGEGLTIDVFSRAAFNRFFEEFDRRIAPLAKGTVRAWFHDSFEYTGNWSAGLLEEFQRRRGYDLRLRLRELNGEGDPETIGRVLSDYRETLSDMLLANVVAPLAEWARQHGGVSRNQAHGSPGNLLDLYAASDIPETEIFGRLGGPDSDPLINKFASSAAHAAGRRLVSAETYTWLDEHFTETLDQMKRAADQLFLAGVNHVFFHGTAYSPADAPWPGWVFYASSQINPRNTIWRHLPALTGYIARVQSVLEAGEPAGEVLLYWPYYDALDNAGAMFQQLAVHGPAWFYREPVGGVARELTLHGYGYDYASDRLLESARVENGRIRLPGASYSVIAVPPCRRMPVGTLEKLYSLAEQGASIVFFNHLPEDVPGLGRLAERRARRAAVLERLRFAAGPAGILQARAGQGRFLLSTALDRALTVAGAVRERYVGAGESRGEAIDARLNFIRRTHAEGFHYFIANTGEIPFDGGLALGVDAASAVLLDPMTGRAGLAQMLTPPRGRKTVRVQLPAFSALIVRTFTTRAAAGPAWPYREAAGAAAAPGGEWRVEFIEGGPSLPAPYSDSRLASWTARGPDAERFAGTARYTLRFDRPAEAANFLLDLGDVRDSARVRLNGRDLGTLIHRPFLAETGALERAGNVLEVEVTNVAANRIRDLDRNRTPWRIFHDINVVNLRYQPFDASGWEVRPAGLLGPVTLTPLAARPR